MEVLQYQAIERIHSFTCGVILEVPLGSNEPDRLFRL